jgi:outer membrane lipoprotein SlyB
LHVTGQLRNTIVSEQFTSRPSSAHPGISTALPWQKVVGAIVGAAVGGVVGPAVGDAVGEAVGEVVGTALGATEGEAVGIAVGPAVGDAVGEPVGEDVGTAVGAAVGNAVGACEQYSAYRAKQRLMAVPLLATWASWTHRSRHDSGHTTRTPSRKVHGETAYATGI